MNEFKYELKRGGSYMYTSKNLTWLERLMYRLKGYKVIRLDNAQFKRKNKNA